jgi:hypothetical protein
MSRLDTLFKNLDQAEIAPPEIVWEKIEAVLKEDDRKVLFWFSKDYAKVATLLFGFVGSIGMFLFLKSNMMPIFNQILEDKPRIVYSNPHKMEEVVQQEKEILANASFPKNNDISIVTSRNKSQNSSNSSMQANHSRSFKMIDKINDVDAKAETSSQTEKETKILDENIEIASQVQENREENSDWELIEPMELIQNESIISENSMKLSTQSYAYEMPTLNLIKESFKPYFYLTTTMGVNAAQVFMNSDAQNSYFSGNATFNRKFGYQFGSEMGYQFSRKWSIESGLFYSQYIQTFSEKNNLFEKNGFMYIDQLEFPLMARYSIFLKEENPLILSFKAGLMYGSVLQYQVNYVERELLSLNEKKYSIDADKRNYNSLQLGYIAGIDFDAFVSQKVALHLSTVTSYLSQLENFPLFSSYRENPKQLATSFAVGMKFKF